jgi:hypothetical protein
MITILPRRTALALLCGAVASAKGPVDPLNASGGVAIKGYDAVAYFDAGAAVKGDRRYTFDWMGARWRFASPESLAKFQAQPERYAPQFGGYCAYAVSENYTADIDPEAWTVRAGKLYLNYSKKVQELWLQDADRRIAAAERNWPALHR